MTAITDRDLFLSMHWASSSVRLFAGFITHKITFVLLAGTRITERNTMKLLVLKHVTSELNTTERHGKDQDNH